jgi:hypothetical protein
MRTFVMRNLHVECWIWSEGKQSGPDDTGYGEGVAKSFAHPGDVLVGCILTPLETYQTLIVGSEYIRHPISVKGNNRRECEKF